jgi:hypothetical protein
MWNAGEMGWDDGIGAKWNHLRDRTKLLVIFGGASVVMVVLLAFLGIANMTDGDPSTTDPVGVGTAVLTAYGWTTHQLGADSEPTRVGCRLLARSYDPFIADESAVLLAESARSELVKVYDPELRRTLYDGEVERAYPNERRVYEWCRAELPDDPVVKLPVVKRWEF